MKKICAYCGKIVDSTTHKCDKRPKDNRKKDINVDSRWRKIRQRVRERDLKCMLCWYEGRFTNGQEVHHITPRGVNDSERMVFNEDNCIYLCRDCHHKVHNDGWKKYKDLFKDLIENND